MALSDSSKEGHPLVEWLWGKWLFGGKFRGFGGKVHGTLKYSQENPSTLFGVLLPAVHSLPGPSTSTVLLKIDRYKGPKSVLQILHLYLPIGQGLGEVGEGEVSPFLPPHLPPFWRIGGKLGPSSELKVEIRGGGLSRKFRILEGE